MERFQRGRSSGASVRRDNHSTLDDCACLDIQLYVWWILQALNVPLLGLPNLPRLGVIQQRDTKSITALWTTEGLQEVTDQSRGSLSASCLPPAVQTEFSLGNTTSDVLFGWVQKPSFSKLPPLCFYEDFQVISTPLEDAVGETT